MLGAREALDEAIANVTKTAFDHLRREHDRGEDVAICVNRALESLSRLQKGGKPDYNEWVAPFYISWYQPRQVHLVYAVLSKSPRRSRSTAIRIIDVGCGAWAAPMALAILAAEGHEVFAERSIIVHGVDPSEPMCRLGEDLWQEFGCAAESRGLARLRDVIDDMIPSITVFPSLGAYRSYRQGETSETRGMESWLLSVHALYEESKEEIRKFLLDYRKRHGRYIGYELITSDETKRWMVDNLTVTNSGRWLGPTPAYRGDSEEPVVQPAWKGILPRTTECRRRIHDELRRSPVLHPDDRIGYLRNDVQWNPSNRIQDDAVWVRSVPR